MYCIWFNKRTATSKYNVVLILYRNVIYVFIILEICVQIVYTENESYFKNCADDCKMFIKVRI